MQKQIELPELTIEQEQAIKEKFRENKRLTADERKIVNAYGEYRFQTADGKKRLKKELTVATVKFFLLIPDSMSLGMGILMWACILIGGAALILGV